MTAALSINLQHFFFPSGFVKKRTSDKKNQLIRGKYNLYGNRIDFYIKECIE